MSTLMCRDKLIDFEAILPAHKPRLVGVFWSGRRFLQFRT